MSREISSGRMSVVRSAEIITPQLSTHDDQRSHSRYLVQRSLTAIPVLPDRQLDKGFRLYGCSVDLSRGGIGFELSAEDVRQTKSLLLGLDGPDGRLLYTGVQVRHVEQLGGSRLRVGAQIAGPAHDFLLAENLSPTFDPRTMEFHNHILQEVTRSWVDANILRPIVCDRVQLCPKCRALPTFRRACRACHSARVTNDRLIHHFACAHAGLLGEFESDGELVCPKCRLRNLVVGADFEYVRGPFRCQDCGWSDMELEQIGHCLRCGHRFPEHQAFEKDLISYHVDRLDPLAFISTP